MPAAIEHKQETTEQSKAVEEPALVDQAKSAESSTVEHTKPTEQPKPVESLQPAEQPLPVQFVDVGSIQQKAPDTTSSAPLLRHETELEADADADVGADDATTQNDMGTPSADTTEDDDAPLFAHESTLSASMVQPEVEEDLMDDEPSHYDEQKQNTHADLDEDDGVPLMRHETSPRAPAVEQFEQNSPLLRHETSPSDFATANENSAPLLRHESMSPENDRSHSDRRISAASSAANTLGAINESEEETETPKPEDVDSSNDSASVFVEAVAERDGKLHQLISDRFEAQTAPTYHIHKHSHKHQQSHTGPIELLTPPMTPDMRESDLVEEERFQPFPAAVSEAKDIPSVTEDQDEIVKKVSPKFESMEIDEQSDKAKSIFVTIKELFLGLGTWFAGLLGGPARATYVIANYSLSMSLIQSIVVLPPSLSALRPRYTDTVRQESRLRKSCVSKSLRSTFTTLFTDFNSGQ